MGYRRSHQWLGWLLATLSLALVWQVAAGEMQMQRFDGVRWVRFGAVIGN